MKAQLNISTSLLFITGVLPVSSVALHSLGWIPIRAMLLPNLVMLTFCAYHFVRNQELKRTLLNGWIGGLIAVFLYDLSRIPFMYFGWGDFIPSLGGWITGGEEDFFVGYLWRYLGNAAGLGLCFSILNSLFRFKRIVLAGLIFGVSVFLCLDIVLMCSDHAQELMFKMTPLNFAGSLTGHVVFGTVLGLFFRRSRRQLRLNSDVQD